VSTNGKNRTFFFFSHEGYRIKNFGSSTYALPTALEKAGDFSQSRNAAGALNVIYDPLTTRTVNGQIVRDPFPDNIIPRNRQNQVALNLLSYYVTPTVNTATGLDNFYRTAKSKTETGDIMIGKIDQQFRPWWSANMSYLHGKFILAQGGPPDTWKCCTLGDPIGVLFNSGVPQLRWNDAVAINNTFILNNSTVAAVRLGFNRFATDNFVPTRGFDPNKLGFVQYSYQSPYFPSVSLTNYSGLSGTRATLEYYYNKNLTTSISKHAGRHDIKGGFEYRGIYLAYEDLSNASGSYSFSGQFTQADPTRAASNTGNSIADLLLGLPFSGSITRTQKFYNYIRYYSGYGQDDFRVNSSLTLNLGLRYEYETGLKERDNNMVVGFDRTAPSPLASAKAGTAGGLIFAGGNGKDQCCDLSKLKFAPRFGFAYSVNNKTVLRGGYAIYYPGAGYGSNNSLQSGYTQVTPLVSSLDSGRTPLPGFTFTDPFPGGPLPITKSSAGLLTGIGTAITAYDQEMKSPMVQQYSFNIQRALPGNLALEVGYIGSTARNLPPLPAGGGNTSVGGGKININQLGPQYFALGRTFLQTLVPNPYFGKGGAGVLANATLTNQQLLLPYPQFASVNLVVSSAKARFHSAVFKVDKRLARVAGFSASYVWSRNMDSAFGTLGGSNGVTNGPQNVYDLNAEYGISAFDVPHRVTGNLTYRLPFGMGRAFLNNNRWLDLVLGGWSFDLTSTIQSGWPISVTQLNLNSVIGSPIQRPNLTGTNPETSGRIQDRLDNFINPAGYSAAPQYAFGNAPRMSGELRTPASNYHNIAITKEFSITEGVRFELRGAATNAFNQPTFGRPDSVLTSSTFGRITSTGGIGSRIITVGGRLKF
jgi:trimeric autotransporter adhesin